MTNGFALLLGSTYRRFRALIYRAMRRPPNYELYDFKAYPDRIVFGDGSVLTIDEIRAAFLGKEIK